MRIKQLEIYGYGKWIDTTFDLTEDFHLFYGFNEAGKSTLMSFLHSILFGFPTRNSTLLRYEPRESSRYGGKIIMTDSRFGEVIVERISGKVTGNVTVTLEDGTTGTDELLETVLHGMTRESFQNIFSFSLTDIENVHRLNKNQLSRYLLNIGAHGTERYLELIDQFQADADKLYRPSGRVLALNKQLSTLEKQEKKLVELEIRNEGYRSLIEQLNQENDEIEAVEKKQHCTEKRLSETVEFQKQLHVFEEINALDSEITKANLPPLKEDGRFLLDEYKREKSDLISSLQVNQVNIHEAKKNLKEPEMIETYAEHKETFHQLENQLPELVEQLRDDENISEKRQTLQKDLLVIEEELGMTDQPVYPTPFTDEEVTKVKGWKQEVTEISAKLKVTEEEIMKTQNELNLKNQRLDQFEEMMWDNQAFKEVEAELQGGKHKKQTNRPFMITGIAGLIFGILAFMLSTPFNWLFGALTILAFVIGFAFSRRQDTVKPNEVLEKEYTKQLQIKKEWQDLLGKLDTLQADYQTLKTEADHYEAGQMKRENQWTSLLLAHHLSATFDLANAEEIFKHIDQLHETVTTDNKLMKQQAELRHKLETETAHISTILNVESSKSYQQKITILREYLMQVKAEMTNEQESLDQLNALKQEEKQLKERIENAQTKLQNLIETAGVKSEPEFIKLYQQKVTIDEKKSRLRYLKENAPAYDAHKTLPSKEAIEKDITALKQKLKELNELKNKALRTMTNTKLSIERLEQDGTYTEELQVFENEKATAQRLVDEWVSDKIAANMIKLTLNEVTKDRFTEIIADAENYFRLLTDDEYERIVFNEDDLQVQMQNGQVVDVRVLSRGTSEPLYVAIRLAYIKNTQDMMELPVIMDDPFVNFDEQRRKNMYRLLQELSPDLQVIYFTFDDTAFKYFRDEQVTNLEMRK